jgi:hypothetical protein
MRASSLSLALSLFLLVTLPVHAMELRGDIRILAMKTLGGASAYLATGNHVLLTSDAGLHWRDAFVAPEQSKLLAAEFIDASTGWILVLRGETLEIYHTIDGARNWNRYALSDFFEDGVAGGSFSFAGFLNGHLMVRIPSSSNSSRGRLFRTTDGGANWVELPTPPIGDAIMFVSEQHGWLTGGPAGTDFFETLDSGRSWVRADLPNITLGGNVSGPVRVHYGVPVFRHQANGYLPVTFDGPDAASLSLYATHDEGASWEFVGNANYKTLGVHPVTLSAGAAMTTDLDETVSILADEAAGERVVLHDVGKKLPAGMFVSSSSFDGGNMGLVASTTAQCQGFKVGCWSETRVFVTRNFGATFEDVTPVLVRDVNRRNRDVAGSDAAAQSVLRRAEPNLIGTGTTLQINREGFETACYPSTLQMQSWWNSPSPYRYVGTYIGGTHAYCVNHSSSCPCPPASWFSTTSGQGWTFIPTWVGIQEQYGDLSLTSTSTAYSQGVSEADAAANRLSALGFPSGSVVYFDFERPHPISTEPYVQAFINGWVSELHARGHNAGIYGSYLSAAAWGSGSVTYPPDAIWPYNLNSPLQTVFGLCGPTYCLPDTLWPNHQRLRQYKQNVSDSQNGVTLTVDQDWADGPTANYNGSSQNPSVTLTNHSVSTTNITVGQSFSISTTVLVGGATVDHAGISVSFPSLTNVGVSGSSYNSSQGTVSTSSITSGALLSYIDDYPSHLLTEGDWSSVPAGTSKSFNLTVTPKATGTFKVRIRGWVTTGGYANVWRDPSSGIVDQQGFWVYEYTVVVSGSTTPPTATTSAASGIGQTSATLNGTVNPNGASTTAWFEWGPTSGYGNATSNQSVGAGTSAVQIPASLSSLTCNTTYHFRAVGSNAGGTNYGSDLTFTTSSCSVTAASVATNTASSLTQTGATLNGTVNPNGSSTTTAFEYGTTTSYGSSISAQTLTGSGSQSISAGVSGLACQTQYHFRARGTNSGGTNYGSDLTFTTSSCSATAPSVATNSASSVTQTGATLNGTVNPNGSSTTTAFEYGTTTSYGSSISAQTLTGSGSQSISSGVSGLACQTQYHFRAKGTNSGGTNYGSDLTFTTAACSGASDLIVDGGFESATDSGIVAPGWVVTPSPGSSHWLIIKNGPYAHAGTTYGSLGGVDYTQYDWLLQTVTIPANATVANLTGWVNVTTQESAGSTAYDVLWIAIYDLSGNPIATLRQLSNLDAPLSNNTLGNYFQVGPFDLTAYKGSSVQIGLVALTDSSYPTTFLVDDVSLQVTTPSDNAPTTSITAPANGATVSGTVNVSASASDDVGVTSLEIYIDGVAKASNTNSSSLIYSWNTTQVSNGQHQIYSKAYDSAGHVTTSSIVTVTVSNVALAAPSFVSATAASAFGGIVAFGQVIGATSYQIFRSSNNSPYAFVGTSIASGFPDSGLSPNTTYLYKVRGVDSANNVGPLSNADIATTVMFTDDPVVAGSTTIQAVHLAELRTAVNAVRAAAGMSPTTFTDSITPGVLIRAIHVAELRSSLDAARAQLGLSPMAYTDPSLAIGDTPVKAAHINELRAGVK